MFLHFWNQLDSTRPLAKPPSTKWHRDNGKYAASLIFISDPAM